MSKEIKYKLKGLDCASCALKIEDGIKKIEGVDDVSINFANMTMSIELEKNDSNLLNLLQDTIESIEPDVSIIGFDDDEDSESIKHIKNDILRLIIGIIPFVIALIIDKNQAYVKLSFFILSYLIIGSSVLSKAFKNILRGQVFDENFLMTIATIGAFIIGEYPEGVAVLLFFEIGELFQNIAVNRSRRSIASLMDIRPDYANLKDGNDILKIDPSMVLVGDIIVVRPGEKVPLDGVIVNGESSFDTSALTGESLPRNAKVNDEVMSGFININGLIELEVTKPFELSTVSRILDLVENASSKKAPTENFISRFARYYTPIVVIIALGLAFIPPIILEGELLYTWVYRALVFLVISCPCALVISIPLGFFGGIGGASRQGILIKGGNYLEALTQVDKVVFDKTGTLTLGEFNVTEINPVDGVDEETVLYFAAIAESHSNHPIAKSIIKAYGELDDSIVIREYEEISGLGIIIRTENNEIIAGNEKLMKKKNINFIKSNSIGSLVYVGLDGEFIGSIVVSDEPKSDSKKTIKALLDMGIENIAMLTGDTDLVGNHVANYLGIDKVYTQLLPDEKVELIEKLSKSKASKGKTAFIGDGINDAPVLARADVGIAMGALGSDAAIEAADIVLMTDEPYKIIDAIKIAKRTRSIVLQNIVLALFVKVIVLIMGAMGFATMWEAVFADVGVTIIAVLNSMRAMKKIN